MKSRHFHRNYYGITELMELSVLEDLLKRQNDNLAQGDIKALKITSDLINKDLYNAIVQLDKVTFDKAIERKKVLINWDSCLIKEHTSQCYEVPPMRRLQSHERYL